eukprot:scaffold12139_cov111-Isochrysis_galbana.AAC.3
MTKANVKSREIEGDRSHPNTSRCAKHGLRVARRRAGTVGRRRRRQVGQSGAASCPHARPYCLGSI